MTHAARLLNRAMWKRCLAAGCIYRRFAPGMPRTGKQRNAPQSTRQCRAPVSYTHLDVYKRQVGDSADNIPGVPGVGPVTAAKWLRQYGSLDAIIAHAAAIPGKIGDKLRASLAQLPLSRQLATLDLSLIHI